MSFKVFGNTSDESLIKSMADGDMEAFAEIYKRYAPGMRRFVTGLIKNRFVAEDIVQNIFMRMMTSKPDFENVSALKSWLFISAKHEVVSTLRSKWESNVEKVEELPEVVSDGVQRDTMMTILDSVLTKMPHRRSVVFRMSKIEGISVEEIAARLGISVRTVQKHLEVADKEVKNYLN